MIRVIWFTFEANGKEGVALILGISAQIDGKELRPELVIDSTVQEKNITYPWIPSNTGKSSSDAGARR